MINYANTENSVDSGKKMITFKFVLCGSGDMSKRILFYFL